MLRIKSKLLILAHEVGYCLRSHSQFEMEPYLDTKQQTIFRYGTKRLLSLLGIDLFLAPVPTHPFLPTPCLSLIQLAPAPDSLQSAHATRMKQVMTSHGVRDKKEVDEIRNTKRNKYFFMIVRARVNSEGYRGHKWRII